MQKKVFLVLATDFCCWFPISLIALLSIVGVPISNTVYAVSAIVLLPINSALNPIIYSNAIDIIQGKQKLTSFYNSISLKAGYASRSESKQVVTSVTQNVASSVV